jgi:hypothetical protein
MPADFNFHTSPLLTFRAEEHVYREWVEQERPYALDAALFAVHGVILFVTLSNLPSGTISPKSVSCICISLEIFRQIAGDIIWQFKKRKKYFSQSIPYYFRHILICRF